MGNSLSRRVELIEQELASKRSPKLVVCFGEKQSDQRQRELGPEYTMVVLRRPSWVETDDAWEAMMSPAEDSPPG